MQVQIWQATRKATKLIKLVTHSNNMNAHYTNLANTQHNRKEQKTKKNHRRRHHVLTRYAASYQ